MSSKNLVQEITARNEIKMKQKIIQARFSESSGKEKFNENHRECRFCYEEQYLNILATTINNNVH